MIEIRQWQLFRRGMIAGLGLILVTGATIAYRASTAAQEPASRWIAVEPRAMTTTLGLVGRIEPASSFAFTAPFEGTIKEVLFQEGERVARGQRLVLLDTSLLELQLAETSSALLKAKQAVYELAHWDQAQEVARARRALKVVQLSLADSERKYTETQALYQRGIVARMEVDALEQQVRSLQLDLTAAQAEMNVAQEKGNAEHQELARMELANAQKKYDALRALQNQRELVAPFAGMITRIPSRGSDKFSGPLQAGSHVTQGEALFGLASLEEFRVRAQVQELDVNRLHEGQAVEITGDGFEKMTLAGKIASVGSQVISDLPGMGASYEVMVAIPALTDAQRHRLKLGMSANLSVITYQNQSTFVLPPEAIRREGDQMVVDYSASKGGDTQAVVVTTGEVTGEGVEVFGLKPGYVASTRSLLAHTAQEQP